MWGDFLTAGKLSANLLELKISRAAFDGINRRYFGASAPGTVLHEILKPAVAVVDAVAGTHLAECGGCASRELWLNAANAP